MSESDDHGHAELHAAIDGLEIEVAHSISSLGGHRTSSHAAAHDLVLLVDQVKPLLLRAHAALMVDERNKPLLNELIEATLDMEECRAKWEAIASSL